jgi:hypothetical protein
MIERKILKVRDPQRLKSVARIVYDPYRGGMNRNTKGWCVADVDRELTRYLRWWTDRELTNITGVEGYGISQPSWDAHISIVRGMGDLRNVPEDMLRNLWGKYEGREVEFEYTLDVRQSGDKAVDGFDPKEHFWFVTIWSDEMTYIRKELGLPYDWNLHLTYGRTYDERQGKFPIYVPR